MEVAMNTETPVKKEEVKLEPMNTNTTSTTTTTTTTTAIKPAAESIIKKGLDDDLYDDETSPPQPNKKVKTENGVVKKVTSPPTKATTKTTTSSTNGKKPIPKKKIISDSSSSDSSDSSDSDSSDSDSSSDSSDSSDSDAPKNKKVVPAKPSKPAPKKTTTTTTTTSSTKPKPTVATKPPIKAKAKQVESDSSSDSDSDSSDSDSSSSEDEKPKKKTETTTTVTKKAPAKKAAEKKTTTTTTTTTKKSTTKKAAAKKEKSDDEEEEAPKKKATKKRKSSKDDDDEEGEEEEEEKNKWWEKENDEDDGTKWTTLSHNGPVFPPAYIPHGIKFVYDSKPFKLTPAQEEIATFYANYIETDHVKKQAFRDNFFADFKESLTPEQKKTVKTLAKCDFSHIQAFLKERKEQRKARPKAEKDQEAAEKKKIQDVHGYAMIDGYKEKVGNYSIEPPGLFLGRGQHPKTGMLKARISPSDVTLNIGEGEKIPISPIKGENWKEVIHNNTVTWLAFWRESINGGFKYVWLAPSSKIKGQADRKKFEVARALKNCIGDIRKGYIESFKDDNDIKRQLGVALYLIDSLALRVGNEKGEDQADTVGCCSLRVEHIKLEDKNTITLDFLGKDSMRYLNTTVIRPDAYKVLKSLVKGKKQTDLLFSDLTVTHLNKHLKNQMTGLSAKVFRTYNASITLQNELDKMDPKEFVTTEEKLLFYNRCNREVAILCNHQRAPPKNFADQLGKIDDRIQELQDLKDLCLLKLGKKSKSKLADINKREADRLPKLIEAAIANKKDKDKEKTDKEISFDVNASFEKSRNIPEGEQKVLDKINRYDDQIKKLEIQKTGKDELKTVALGTSKINYLDPRITVAWCKKNKVPVEKILTKALREKFPWSDVEKDYKF